MQFKHHLAQKLHNNFQKLTGTGKTISVHKWLNVHAYIHLKLDIGKPIMKQLYSTYTFREWCWIPCSTSLHCL